MDDFLDIRCRAFDGEGDVFLAERAVTHHLAGLFVLAREIKFAAGNVFALGVAPDIQLGPVQDRVDAQVRAFGEFGFVLIPEFGRLVLEVPVAVDGAGGEDALLGAQALLVPPDPGDHALEIVFAQERFQTFRLAHGRTGGGGKGLVHILFGRAHMVDAVQVPLFNQVVPEVVNFLHFHAGIEQDQRKRHAPQKRLAHQPEQSRGVLTDGPEHAHRVHAVIGFADDINALGFELVEILIHFQPLNWCFMLRLKRWIPFSGPLPAPGTLLYAQSKRNGSYFLAFPGFCRCSAGLRCSGFSCFLPDV